MLRYAYHFRIFSNHFRNNLRLGGGKATKPVFLVEPLVMLGDLDKDIAGRNRGIVG